jgi:hypothetical protein
MTSTQCPTIEHLSKITLEMDTSKKGRIQLISSLQENVLQLKVCQK